MRKRATISRRNALCLGAGTLISACSPRGDDPKPGTSPPRIPGKPNVILLIPDALRADALGIYGCPRPTSPAIDAFFAGGYCFERCVSQASWTKPAIASLYTGVLPSVHHAAISRWDTKNLDKFPVQVLRDQFVTLAEGFKNAGYDTALSTFNPHVQKQFGFAQGFAHYSYDLEYSVAKHVDHALGWIKQNLREPFFLVMHMCDPHGPYTPDAACFRTVAGSSAEDIQAALPKHDRELLEEFRTLYVRQTKDPDVTFPPLHELSKDGTQYLRLLYEAEVLGVDKQFERFAGQLSAAGLVERTVFALTSDHGEAFNEHGNFKHGYSLFQGEIHVPLLMRWPGKREAKRIQNVVGLFDLYPTLLSAIGAPAPEYVQGQTLLTGEGIPLDDAERAVFSCLDHYKADVGTWDASMIQGRHKVMSRGNGRKILVFDLATDPGEDNPIWRDGELRNETVIDLLTSFRSGLERHRKLARRFGEEQWTHASEELAEQLNTIGYL